MGAEVELKLGIAAEDLPRLRRLGLLFRGGLVPAATKHLKTTYFDTPDRILAASRITLRVREDGDRRLHCIKLPVESLAGLATRREWEVESADTTPNFAAFVPGTVDSLLDLEKLTAAGIEPVFVTDFRRSVRLMPLGDDGVVEIAIDEGTIRAAGGAEAPISELEFELKSGSAAALFDLALAVTEQVPARIIVEAKGERGARLAAAEPPPAVKAPKLALGRGQSVSDAFARIVQDCVGQWLANVEAVLDGSDAEGVHQMRVALRRLRSAFRLFRRVLGPEPATMLSNEVKWLAGSLGPARDWDVFIGDVAGPVFEALGPDGRFERILELARSEQGLGYGVARAAIEEPRHTRLALTLGRFAAGRGWQAGGKGEILDGPVETFAAGMLDAHFKRVRQKGRHIMRLDAEALHGLRIEIKRLRYALEFFGSLFDGREVKHFHEGLAGLQDFLGNLNDLTVAHRLIGSLGRADAGRAYAEGVLAGFHGASLDRKRAKLREQWAAVLAQEPFWRE
ncbi:CHAD domain-containing protein [Oleomonas cavernae]|uniref:CHAD domain-containing protein n=1 Tax=Oleomonas cavernae TaxID=2320859 RepID=A0A418WFI4_9PROT|nr:CYTH and CHAD domain-containing protein [Oleomonas cavernae]RJF88752.1 CHAD domain-containing protein [Oleomonas cavernae]